MRLLALFAIAVIPLTATAQMGDVLPGARVRVIVHGGQLAGALVSRTTDSLLIAQTTSGSGAPAPGIAAYVDATYGGIGAAIGAAVGADRWTTVPLRPSISALPNGRFGVGLNLRQRLSTCGARF